MHWGSLSLGVGLDPGIHASQTSAQTVRKPAARRSTEPHLEALAEFAPVLRLHPQGLLLVVGKSSQSLTEGLALTRATVHVVECAPAVDLTRAVLHARGLPTFHTKPHDW